MRRAIAIVIGVIVILIVLLAIALSRFELSAIPNPGAAEAAAATHAKDLLVWRESRHVPSPPKPTPGDLEEGDKLFGTECAACHGMDGHSPTDAGRWMYPRAADLTSATVQSYSDPELFWIIKNGVRLSGMPAFGRVEPDQHIWDLVWYLRKLKSGGAQD